MASHGERVLSVLKTKLATSKDIIDQVMTCASGFAVLHMLDERDRTLVGGFINGVLHKIMVLKMSCADEKADPREVEYVASVWMQHFFDFCEAEHAILNRNDKVSYVRDAILLSGSRFAMRNRPDQDHFVDRTVKGVLHDECRDLHTFVLIDWLRAPVPTWHPSPRLCG